MKASLDKARALIAAVTLEQIRLVSMRAESSIRSPKDVGDQMKVAIGHDANVLGGISEGRFFVRAVADIQVSGASEPGKSAFRVGCVHELRYRVSPDLVVTDDGLTAFAKLNGTFHAWPYWRELVQSTLARMGLPPLALPVFRPQDHAGSKPETGEPAPGSGEGES